MYALVTSMACAAAAFFAMAALSAAPSRARSAARLQSISQKAASADAVAVGDTGRLRRAQNQSQFNWPFASAIRRDLQRAGLAWQVRDFVGLVVGLALFGGIVGGLLASWGGALVVGLLIGIGGPLFLVKRAAKKRATLLNSQIVDLVELLSSSLRSGFSFMQATELASHEAPEPMATELRRVLRESSLGISTDEALERLAERTGDEDLELVVSAVLIQRRVGGNLSEVLGGIVGMMRDRGRVAGEIQTMTAQARMSSWMVGALPIIVGLAMTLIQPDYMSTLINESMGRLMLGGAALLEVIGLILVRRIAAVDY